MCFFTCEWGLIVPKCLNVVVFNWLYMVSKIWMSRETIFGHKEAIILHVRHGKEAIILHVRHGMYIQSDCDGQLA
jgi:hypothetical protein